MKASDFPRTKRGSTIGFTAEKAPIVGQYMPARKAFVVGIAYTDQGISWERYSFPTRGQAADFANQHIDEDMSEELRWW